MYSSASRRLFSCHRENPRGYLNTPTGARVNELRHETPILLVSRNKEGLRCRPQKQHREPQSQTKQGLLRFLLQTRRATKATKPLLLSLSATVASACYTRQLSPCVRRRRLLRHAALPKRNRPAARRSGLASRRTSNLRLYSVDRLGGGGPS